MAGKRPDPWEIEGLAATGCATADELGKMPGGTWYFPEYEALQHQG